MSRTETQDGTYYYAEMVFRAGGLPRLLRTRLVDGVPHDEVWQVDTGEWVRTDELSDYRLNLEEEEIEPITPAPPRRSSRRSGRSGSSSSPVGEPQAATLTGGLVEARRERRSDAHRDQVDKAGRAYVDHPARVAARVADDPVAAAVAWLHDTVEDTGTTLDELRRRGFPAVVRDAVDAMTRRTTRTPTPTTSGSPVTARRCGSSEPTSPTTATRPARPAGRAGARAARGEVRPRDTAPRRARAGLDRGALTGLSRTAAARRAAAASQRPPAAQERQRAVRVERHTARQAPARALPPNGVTTASRPRRRSLRRGRSRTAPAPARRAASR